MNTSTIVGIVAAIIIIGGLGWYAVSRPAPAAPTPQAASASTTMDQDMAMPATTTSSAPTSVTTSTTVTTTTSAPAPQSFTVNGNDETADLKTITVPAGTPVAITFGADAGTTYHGGLDFRSSVVSTGTITPGSTKTISFTAANSFSFTPYWPATNIAKPYTIDIVVK